MFFFLQENTPIPLACMFMKEDLAGIVQLATIMNSDKQVPFGVAEINALPDKQIISVEYQPRILSVCHVSFLYSLFCKFFQCSTFIVFAFLATTN
jgi:hypothetical protein